MHVDPWRQQTGFLYSDDDFLRYFQGMPELARTLPEADRSKALILIINEGFRLWGDCRRAHAAKSLQYSAIVHD